MYSLTYSTLNTLEIYHIVEQLNVNFFISLIFNVNN